MYFANMADDLGDFFFMLSPVFIFFVKISNPIRTKGSKFHSWALKHGTAKNASTMHEKIHIFHSR